MKDVRNTNIELLRLLLMCFILCWHILIHGLGFSNIKSIGGGILLPLLAPATYCFMFITGFYGISFSQKTFYKIILQLIIAAVLCCTLVWMIFDSFNIQHFVGAFVPVSTSFWWFMTNYLIITLLSPIINPGIRSITKSQFRFIVIVLWFIQFVSYIKLNNSAGSSFLGLFSVFILGRFCGIYKVVPSLKISIYCFILAWVLQIAIMLTCANVAPKYLFTTLNYNTVPLTVMSVMLFYIFYNLPVWKNHRLNTILRPTLFIYLITEGLSKPLYLSLYNLYVHNVFLFVVAILFLIISCMLIGCLIDIISNKLLLVITKEQ